MRTSSAKPVKVYVGVKADFTPEGVMLPREITWEDGEIFQIDKISRICQAAALRAGGQGDRYTIHMKGHETYLFFERSTDLTGNNIGRWFVERK